LFAINMLVATPGGDTYTFKEIRDALEQAGFTEVQQVRSGERMDCLVEARKPR
jgi:phosphoribosylformylglycinamidine (FGAM) synthase PurS component